MNTIINHGLAESLLNGKTARNLSDSGQERKVMIAELTDETVLALTAILKKSKVVTPDGNSFLLDETFAPQAVDPVTQKPRGNPISKITGYSAGIIAAVVTGQKKAIKKVNRDIIEVYYLPLVRDNIPRQGKQNEPKYERIQLANSQENANLFKEFLTTFTEQAVTDGMAVKFDIANVMTFPANNGGTFDMEIPSGVMVLNEAKTHKHADAKKRNKRANVETVAVGATDPQPSEEDVDLDSKY